MRNYASYFDWHDKPRKELGVVEDLFKSIPECPYHSAQNSPKDPPDCIAQDANGKGIGFEVVELVDQKAIKRNIGAGTDSYVYRDWSDPDMKDRIKQILADKDGKNYHGSPYEKLILVIHTDEPILDPKRVCPILENCKFQKPKQITDAYLLFSYHPNHQPSNPFGERGGLPCVKLQLI